MNIKKRIKCLICRVLFKLGLVKACNAGPLPTLSKTLEKSTKKTKSKKKKY